MDVLNHYTEFLSLFLALIITGVGIMKTLNQQTDERTYDIGQHKVSRQKVHTILLVVTLGLVIQIVANSIEHLNGTQLLKDPKVLGAYGLVFLMLALKK